MRPDRFRSALGFAGLSASLVTLLTTSSSLAQGFNTSGVAGVVPLAVAAGAGALPLLLPPLSVG